MQQLYKNDLISVIVPAYNVEKYIEKCLTSISKQKYKNIEVLVINDGSTDLTRNIVSEFCEKDARFILIDKENGGLSSARNKGLDFANGKYITFVDSDDYLSDNYVSNLYEAIKKDSNCKIAVSRIKNVYEGENDPCTKNKGTKIVKVDVAIKKMLLRRGYTHCAYSKLYCCEIWENEKFPTGRLYEDYLTTYSMFVKTDFVAMVDSEDYYYLQRQNSIMHSAVSEKYLSLLNVADEVTDWFKNNRIKLYRVALELKIANYLKVYQRILNSDTSNFEYQKLRIKKEIKDNFLFIIFNFNVPIKDKAKSIALMVGDDFFAKLYNRFSKE